ncbi:hypothetical protein ACFL6S_36090, partial [Candidatus Poribacteria bacterium]
MARTGRSWAWLTLPVASWVVLLLVCGIPHAEDPDDEGTAVVDASGEAIHLASDPSLSPDGSTLVFSWRR